MHVACAPGIRLVVQPEWALSWARAVRPTCDKGTEVPEKYSGKGRRPLLRAGPESYMDQQFWHELTSGS